MYPGEGQWLRVLPNSCRASSTQSQHLAALTHVGATLPSACVVFPLRTGCTSYWGGGRFQHMITPARTHAHAAADHRPSQLRLAPAAAVDHQSDTQDAAGAVHAPRVGHQGRLPDGAWAAPCPPRFILCHTYLFQRPHKPLHIPTSSHLSLAHKLFTNPLFTTMLKHQIPVPVPTEAVRRIVHGNFHLALGR